MRGRSLLALAAGVAAVIAGVVLGGTARHPAALVLPFITVTAVLDLRRPSPLVRLVLAPVVVGASAAGVAWTLGPERAAAPAAGLVWIGLAVSVAASLALTPLRRGGAGRGPAGGV